MSSWQFIGPSRVNFDERAMYNLLLNPKGTRGTVGWFLRRMGDDIYRDAIAMVGKQTGRLMRSIKRSQHARGNSQYLIVKATAPHAYMHHEGTAPHLITPGGHGRILTFNAGGKRVVAKVIKHPGTKKNLYLRKPMERAVRRGGPRSL